MLQYLYCLNNLALQDFGIVEFWRYSIAISNGILTLKLLFINLAEGGIFRKTALRWQQAGKGKGLSRIQLRSHALLEPE